MNVELRNKNNEYLLKTLDEIDNNKLINSSLSKSKIEVINKAKVIKPNKKYNTKISFTHSDVVNTILDNRKKKLCALVFSSSLFNNRLGIYDTQEDSILRASTLYKLINTSYCLENFYSANKNLVNINSTNRCVYLSNIFFFKNGKDDIILGKNNNAYSNLILSCPPSFNNGDFSNDIQYNVIYCKLKNVFNIAVEKEEEVLILGAYGCGKANNSPSLVAKAFKRLLNEYNGYFKEIIFSIKSKNELDMNYFTFKNTILCN